jgi:glycine/D-amino acid oxidase-like deaminating enzyme
MRPIEQSCYWLATRENSAPSASLNGYCRAQTVIVGAGFTGLWTAYFLKQWSPQLDVVVVEQGVAGYGASGRNAGIVGASIDHSHALSVTHFGWQEAQKLARIGQHNVQELADFAFDCDFERTGQLNVALTETQVAEGINHAQAAANLGVGGYRILSAAETQAEIHSPLYMGSIFAPGGGVLNPIKLVDKLKQNCMQAGVKFFEQTKVVDLDGTGIVTREGNISADKIILATDAYTHHLLPRLLDRFIPLYDYILVSEPLSEAQLKAIGWSGRQGVVDGRTFFNYYRLTADNRVLWGTSEAMYYPPNRVDSSCDHSQAHYDALHQSFYHHFPQLSELQFPYAWGGPIASTTRLTPFFGSEYEGHVIYGLGYTGHGIGSTRLAGKILACMALERHSDLLDLKMVKYQPFPYPPEPVRAAAVKAVAHSLKQVDAGNSPNWLLRTLDALGIGFSS